LQEALFGIGHGGEQAFQNGIKDYECKSGYVDHLDEGGPELIFYKKIRRRNS
jgi:hypothetical protein